MSRSLHQPLVRLRRTASSLSLPLAALLPFLSPFFYIHKASSNVIQRSASGRPPWAALRPPAPRAALGVARQAKGGGSERIAPAPLSIPPRSRGYLAGILRQLDTNFLSKREEEGPEALRLGGRDRDRARFSNGAALRGVGAPRRSMVFARRVGPAGRRRAIGRPKPPQQAAATVHKQQRHEDCHENFRRRYNTAWSIFVRFF